MTMTSPPPPQEGGGHNDIKRRTVTLKLTTGELRALEGTLSGVRETEMSDDQRSAYEKISDLIVKMHRRSAKASVQP